jgi:hypothetical protein
MEELGTGGAAEFIVDTSGRDREERRRAVTQTIPNHRPCLSVAREGERRSRELVMDRPHHTIPGPLQFALSCLVLSNPLTVAQHLRGVELSRRLPTVRSSKIPRRVTQMTLRRWFFFERRSLLILSLLLFESFESRLLQSEIVDLDTLYEPISLCLSFTKLI